MPKMSTTSENGRIAIVAAAVIIEITGATREQPAVGVRRAELLP